MRSVNIGDKNTFTEWELYLTDCQIELPSAKTSYVDVPFADGSLDLTEAFTGNVVYNNRKLSFTFETTADSTVRARLLESLASHLHGRKHKIVLQDDPDHYYMGRLAINQYQTNRAIGKIVIEADCEPYRYKTDATVVNATLVVAPSTIICSNSRKRVIPTFTLSAETTIEFGDKTIVANAGTHRFTNIIFTEGDNTLTVSGVPGATVKITYQEGGL